MKIMCVGDSLTYGNVGYSYIHFLDKRIKAVNRGKNGDTIKGAAKRLNNILTHSKNDCEVYIIGIGTNDLFLPYLKTVSLFWFLQMSIRSKLKKCIEDDNEFVEEYEKLLTLLSQHNKKVVLFGSPFINLKNFPHEKLVKRNKMLKELAQKYDYPFIDVYSLQKENIETDHRVYTWKYRFLVRVFDAIIMTLFPSSKDLFSKLRGLTTSVDGAHFNSTSANLLALEIEKYL